MTTLKLDFSIPTTEGRRDFVDALVQQKTADPNYKFTTADLELLGNYILYGRDADTGESAVDRHDVIIKTKYGSYDRKDSESLDAIMDNPLTNETTIFRPLERSVYTKKKPTIDRSVDCDIPELLPLWDYLDLMQHKLNVSLGKEHDIHTTPITNPTHLYKLNHMLIDMRRDQFVLRDSYKPVLPLAQNKTTYVYDIEGEELDLTGLTSCYGFAPLGLYFNGSLTFSAPYEDVAAERPYNTHAKYLIDFTNPKHVYRLLEHYEDLSIAAAQRPNSTLSALVHTIDYYVEHADLSRTQTLVLNSKIKHLSNIEIRSILINQLDLSPSINYISTIYTQQVCGKIADAATLHLDQWLNRFNLFAWKKCSCCGRTLLKDTREFVRKKRSSDGLSNQCKRCDREKRRGDTHGTAK
jgi:hypothetical protein